MSKRFVPRGADPAADAYAAAESPLPGSLRSRPSKNVAPPAERPPRPVPAPTAVRDAIVRASWTAKPPKPAKPARVPRPRAIRTAALVADAERRADERRAAAGLKPLRPPGGTAYLDGPA